MNGYCNYFNCFCDSDLLEKEQDEYGEICLTDVVKSVVENAKKIKIH